MYKNVPLYPFLYHVHLFFPYKHFYTAFSPLDQNNTNQYAMYKCLVGLLSLHLIKMCFDVNVLHRNETWSKHVFKPFITLVNMENMPHQHKHHPMVNECVRFQ